jgi:hypothetical protein
MICPKCGGAIKPWHWEGDGGYRGIQCIGCGQQWWSGSLVKTFHDVITPMIISGETRVIASNEFPADAETVEDRTARLIARHAIRKSEAK